MQSSTGIIWYCLNEFFWNTGKHSSVSIQQEIHELGRRARAAAHVLSRLETKEKNRILSAMADAIDARRASIQDANHLDLAAGRAAGLTPALLDRLELTGARVQAMSDGLRVIVELPDPVGEVLRQWTRPIGIAIEKIRVPIGVIGIIYESRPNVTADGAALCFKTSNAVILRGGKEAVHSNRAIADTLRDAGREAGCPEDAIQLVQSTDREGVRHLVQMTEFVDIIIPRGGEGLIRAVAEQAHVPVIKHYKGVCHTYVDADADLEMAMSICENAKVQRPGVCNAMETMLVHTAVAPAFLPEMAGRLQSQGVELRGDAEARRLVPGIKEATDADWEEEYLDLILAVRIVPDLDAAIDHINTFGSHHSDAIVTESAGAQAAFTQRIDSAAVYVNASTRFTDGAEFGMGAEIGISTDKLHARGPVGLEELTTYKYVILGNGQIKE
jgi:glutamate-5-semialdehyde dehydrogenase